MTADRWTDKALARLEARIKKEYKQARDDLQTTWQNYLKGWTENVGGEIVHHKGLKERWLLEYNAMKDRQGNYAFLDNPEEAFKMWEISQIGRGARWEDMKNQMNERMIDASKIAQDYTNGILPSVYVKNSNEVATIAQKSAIDQGVTGIRFDMVDEYTVKRLMEDSHEIKPYKKMAINLPKSSNYNKTKLQSALLQGILQGDSIDHIADRFQKVSDMNRSSAIRNARTSVTGAQSAGKQDRYEELAEKGCDVYKMWISTDDDRTREEHMEAGREYGDESSAIPYDEPFEIGGEELMYPADPSGSPWNIYNCRCTMQTVVKFNSILGE